MEKKNISCISLDIGELVPRYNKALISSLLTHVLHGPPTMVITGLILSNLNFHRKNVFVDHFSVYQPVTSLEKF